MRIVLTEGNNSKKCVIFSWFNWDNAIETSTTTTYSIISIISLLLLLMWLLTTDYYLSILLIFLVLIRFIDTPQQSWDRNILCVFRQALQAKWKQQANSFKVHNPGGRTFYYPFSVKTDKFFEEFWWGKTLQLQCFLGLVWRIDDNKIHAQQEW